MDIKKLFFIYVIVFASCIQFASATRYYWVGNGGNWTDVGNHWSRNSGDSSLMHSVVPGPNDTVVFDENSFSLSGQSVFLDTLIAECATMDWSGINKTVFFYSGIADTLRIHGSCLLSVNLNFNFKGTLEIVPPTPSSPEGVAMLDFALNKLKCDVALSSDTAVLLSSLYLPNNHLSVIDGSFNTNGHNVSCLHFNTDATLKNSIAVSNPGWYNNDSLTVRGSIAISDSFSFHQNGPVFFYFNVIDSNFINIENNTIFGDVMLQGIKNMTLCNPLSVDRKMDFKGGGKFYSQGYDINAGSLSSTTSLIRTINLSTSTLNLSKPGYALSFTTVGLNLDADSAILKFNYSGSDTVRINTGEGAITRFKEVHLPSSNVMIYSSFKTSLLALGSNSNIALARGITITLDSLQSAGDCGHYNYIKAFCRTCPTCNADNECDTLRPIFQFTGMNTTEYLKLRNIRSAGFGIIANNSIDEGNNSGWVINEPTTSDTLYWIGLTDDWNDPQNWSETSGVFTPNSCLPTRKTTVLFDNPSFGTVDSIVTETNAYCNHMIWTNTTNHGSVKGSGTIIVAGDLTLSAQAHFSLSGGILLHSDQSDTTTITHNGADIDCDVEISGTPERRLADTFVSNGRIILTEGILNLSGYNLHCNSLMAGGNKFRTLKFSNSTIFLNGSDTTWKSSGTNLSLINNSSSVRLMNPGPDFVVFDAGDQIFDTLDIFCPKTRIASGMDCNLIRLRPGMLLECEPLDTIRFNNIDASGTCLSPIILSNYSGSTDTALFMVNTLDSINSISVSNVIIKNVCALSDSSHIYHAMNSVGLNKFSGWDLTGGSPGNTYYWTGIISTSWNNPENWEVNSDTATCVPGPMDTVVFDKLHLLAPFSHDTTVVSENAYFRQMIWTDSITGKPALLLGSDLFCTGSAFLCDSLTISYTADYRPSDSDAPSFTFIPQGIKGYLDPYCKDFGVNVCIQGQHLTDTIFLLDKLSMDVRSNINIVSGTFTSNEKNIYTGIISSTGTAMKNVDFSNSDITATYAFMMQGKSLLNLKMDSSILVMEDNSFFYNKFNGGGQSYNSIEFKSRPSGYTQIKYQADIESSDSIQLLKINPGIHLQLESGITQILDSIILDGKCSDSIYIFTSENGIKATLKKVTSSPITGVCLNLKDIIATNGATCNYSKDLGGNSNWNFSPDKTSTASFSLPAATCFNDSIHFTNTTTTPSGNLSGLNFIWSFGDNDSSSLFEPIHRYSSSSSYNVTLTSTDSIYGCSDIFSDSITLHRPDVYLSTTSPDFSICSGDSVFFSASSTDTNTLFQFMVAGDSVINSANPNFNINNLSNGDDVFVILTYEGCTDTSNSFYFQVDSLPLVRLTMSESDTAICAADTLVFNASGADKYQLFWNGSVYTSFSTNDEWSIPSISNGDEFTLFGQYSTTGCSSSSSDTLTITVHPLPNMNLLCSDPDLTICSGNQVIFTATGATFYQFFKNGDTLGTASSIDTLALTDLSNGDMVTVAGISSFGCSANSNSTLEFNVLLTPTVSLSSSDPDNVICQGDEVTFSALGADMYQFSIDGDTLGPFQNSNSFTSDSLFNDQVITVEGILGVCPAQADSSITIDVRPTITWSWSADEICAYDTIHFVAHGDVLYQYFINGNPIGLPGVDSSFNAVSLTNGQQITVGGSAGACTPAAVTITVNPVPIVPMTCSDPDTAICTGQTLTFSGSGALKYQYSVDGDTIGPFSFFNTYTTDSITNGQSISLTAISAEGCLGTSPDIYTITVEPYPVVTLSQSDPDLTICEGDTVSFTSGGADFYEFFVNGTSQGLAGPGNVFTTSALVNGANVLVEGTTGICTAPAVSIYSYTVHPFPIVTFTALTPLSYCQGDTLKLSAGGALSYEYFIDGLSTGAPTMNNLFTSTTLTSGQNVSVTGSRFGCASPGNTDYTVSVNNYPLVGLTADLPSLDLCYGEPVVFSATGADHYIFYLDNIPVSTDSLFTTADLEAGQTITLTGGNGACWANADTSISLNVHYINLTLDCSQPSGVICAGDQPSFSAGGADLYEFFIDGISQGTPSASGTFAPAQLTDGQVVSVAGTSSSTGCTQMAAENLLIHVYPSPELPALDAICEGDSALLSSSVPGNLIWYHNASLIADASGQSIYIDQPGSYQVALSAGGDSICLSSGTNFYGQLGDNTQTNSLVFTEALNLGPITALACGEDFTLALLSDGTVKSWGKNEFGALGTGNFTNAAAPVNAGAISNATKIAAGMRHSLALLQDSTLLAWGDNTLGQLGLGSYSTCNFPYPVTILDHIVDIAAGDNFSLALTADGHIWAWGLNQVGQLGDGTVTNSNHPVLVTGIDQVAAIRAGGNHSIALKDDGSLWVWGANNAGQLGNGTFIGSQSPVKVVLPIGLVSFDGGFSHTIAADSAGHVYCWGDNTFGQIGNGNNTPATYPVKVSAAGNTTLVRAGKYSSYAIRTDKNVFSWGLNTSGQLGQQHTNAVSVPMAAQTLFGVNTLDAGLAHCAALSGNLHTCSSNIISLQVEPLPDVTLYLQGLTLYTTTSGSAYQWYYNGNLIPGAIDSTLQLAAMGAYAVEVSFDNGCTAFSDDYQYQSGIDSETSDDLYALYPNPNNGIFTIRLSGSALAEEIERIRVIDVVGRIVYTDNSSAQSDLILMDLSGTPDGMYVIEILLQGGQKIRKPFMVN